MDLVCDVRSCLLHRGRRNADFRSLARQTTAGAERQWRCTRGWRCVAGRSRLGRAQTALGWEAVRLAANYCEDTTQKPHPIAITLSRAPASPQSGGSGVGRSTGEQDRRLRCRASEVGSATLEKETGRWSGEGMTGAGSGRDRGADGAIPKECFSCAPALKQRQRTA